jgi:hypothetical protein
MEQTKRKYRIVKPMVLVAICSILFSFSARMGGDSFEIYLNNRLVFQQFVTRQEGVKYLQLDRSLYNGQVIVYYSHCGQTGKGRSITIRDRMGRSLKEWHFSDSDGVNNAMSCKVKDILGLQNSNKNAALSLFYSSRELPNGRQLASIIFADNKQTAKR